MTFMNYVLNMQNGIMFKVVLINKGDSYGLNNSLVYQNDIPSLEFYDTRYVSSCHGKYIASYPITTFMSHVGGIQLDGSTPSWFLTKQNVDVIQKAFFAQQLIDDKITEKKAIQCSY